MRGLEIDEVDIAAAGLAVERAITYYVALETTNEWSGA
jgi:hypothetical protein